MFGILPYWTYIIQKYSFQTKFQRFAGGYLLTSRCKNNTRGVIFCYRVKEFGGKVKIFYGICGPLDRLRYRRSWNRMIKKKDTARSTSTSSATMSLLVLLAYYLFFSCSFNVSPFAVRRYF